MVPIYELGHQSSIGYSFMDFMGRFQQICREHLENHRAKAFAFIFFDFNNNALQTAIQGQEGFTILDRLSGTEVSVFFLHSDKRQLIKQFNKVFTTTFGTTQQAGLPLVMLVRFDGKANEILDLQVHSLSTNRLLVFDDLRHVLDTYIQKLPEQHDAKKSSRVAGTINRFLKIGFEEFFKLIFEDAYKAIIRPH